MAKRSKKARCNRNAGSHGYKKRKFGDDWRWYRDTPRWWRLVFMTRPKRREVKRLETKILKGEDAEELVWPVDKKPHLYYW